MKRLLYLAALALTVLTSCKNDEAVVEPKYVENGTGVYNLTSISQAQAVLDDKASKSNLSGKPVVLNIDRAKGSPFISPQASTRATLRK